MVRVRLLPTMPLPRQYMNNKYKDKDELKSIEIEIEIESQPLYTGPAINYSMKQQQQIDSQTAGERPVCGEMFFKFFVGSGNNTACACIFTSSSCISCSGFAASFIKEAIFIFLSFLLELNL
mgnify:CR=1 FL=1|jgi:hypothetical protein